MKEAKEGVPEAVNQLNNELKMLKHMAEHDTTSIVKLLNTCTNKSGNATCIALEYIEDTVTLRDSLMAMQNEHILVKLELMSKIVQSLQEIHKCSVLHCDFSSNNILVCICKYIACKILNLS